MRTWAKASTPAALLAVAVMSFGGGTASADTDGDHSIGGGNQVNLPITLPIDISGNAVAVAGQSSASSEGGATVVDEGRGGGSGNRTSGRSSILGGNQIDAPITAPVNACGNAVSLFGKSDAGCKGGSTVRKSGKGSAGGNRTDGDHSIGGGNQVVAPITAPINACGNAVAIFGDAVAGCVGGASVRESGGAGAGGNRTSGRSSILGGNQVVAPITAPVNICGNSVAAFGKAFSGCKGGASAETRGRRHQSSQYVPRGSSGNDTDGRFGAGSGNQVVAPITLPVNVCGNSVGNATSGCKGGATAHQHGSGTGAGNNRTSGRSSVLGGNQVVAPITAPVNVCGNAVGVLGDAFAGCTGGVSVKNGGKGAGNNRTSGRSSVLGGNQVVAPITAPINVCGNAAAVLGNANAHCKGGASVPGKKGVAAGDNRTSGRSSVLGGNQVVAPITAPVNVCGNAAAALGDAAAGCLGGAHVGKPGPHKGYHSAKPGKVPASGAGAVPPVPGLPADMGSAKEMSGGLPVVGDLAGSLGLPKVPGLPGLPAAPEKPAQQQKPAKPAKKHTAQQPSGGALGPASGLVSSTPVGGAVKSVTRGLPTGDLGLMSAEQPAGVTGMSTASLLALALGGLFAMTASLFAATRRFRPTAK